MTPDTYQATYQRAIADPDTFWAEQARDTLSWITPWKTVRTGALATYDTRWFEGGELNACYQCVDRHLEKHADKVAIYWEGNATNEYTELTYRALYEQVGQLANYLKSRGVKKGDAVCIYMPMLPEAIVAMLACARIGAMHSVVFAGFSTEALRHRIEDADCTVVITANVGLRANKTIPLKNQVDTAIANAPDVHTVLVVRRNDERVSWLADRDFWYHEAIKPHKTVCPPQTMKANDPLFVLYTSGSTGKPKGIVHSTAGYLLYTALTFKVLFDYQPQDIFWCTADIGWITGHSYSVYGPLCNGASIVLFEGTPTYPTPERYWQIIDKYRVTTFYTAPTAIRALMREGDTHLASTRRDSLKLLGSVGEPINPEAWEWYYKLVGKQRCPILDTWWQTETGGIMLSPPPIAGGQKPGAAGMPFFGITPKIIDDAGNLVITTPWPGMMLTVYGDPLRFQHYFEPFPGNYLTGDSAKQDADGTYWITGRMDDVINVSGHRLCTAEIESAILKHPDIVEAAVVGATDAVTGQSVYAFVTAKKDVALNDRLKSEIQHHVRETIGAFAVPKTITWAKALPKTRSGKIMRRLLKKIVDDDLQSLGDISTLTAPETINTLIAAVKTQSS